MTQKYVVQWSYKSGIGGPWGAGAVVNLDDDVAEAINKDSPDVLVLWTPKPEPEPETETPKRAPKAPEKDRQMTGRATRRKPASKNNNPTPDDN